MTDTGERSSDVVLPMQATEQALAPAALLLQQGDLPQLEVAIVHYLVNRLLRFSPNPPTLWLHDFVLVCSAFHSLESSTAVLLALRPTNHCLIY